MYPKLYAYLIEQVDPKKPEYEITLAHIVLGLLSLGIAIEANYYVEESAHEWVHYGLGLGNYTHMDQNNTYFNGTDQSYNPYAGVDQAAFILNISGQSVVNAVILFLVMLSATKMFKSYLPYMSDHFTAMRNSEGYHDMVEHPRTLSKRKLVSDGIKTVSSLSVAVVFLLISYYELKKGEFQDAPDWEPLLLSLAILFYRRG